MNEALIRRNAAACENAKHSACDCACGGKMHGKRHGEDWIRSRLQDLGPEPGQARAKLTVVELDAEFGTDNQGALDSLAAVRSAFKKVFGGGT